MRAYPAIGSRVHVEHTSRAGVTLTSGTVLADRFPDSVLGLRADNGALLRIPWGVITKVAA